MQDVSLEGGKGVNHKAISSNACMSPQNNILLHPSFPLLFAVTAPTFSLDVVTLPAFKIVQDLLSFCINSIFRLNLGPSQIHSFSFHGTFCPGKAVRAQLAEVAF